MEALRWCEQRPVPGMPAEAAAEEPQQPVEGDDPLCLRLHPPDGSSGICESADRGFARRSPAAESTAENYSSQGDPERVLSTRPSPMTWAKTFSDRPAASSQRGIGFF